VPPLSDCLVAAAACALWQLLPRSCCSTMASVWATNSSWTEVVPPCLGLALLRCCALCNVAKVSGAHLTSQLLLLCMHQVPGGPPGQPAGGALQHLPAAAGGRRGHAQVGFGGAGVMLAARTALATPWLGSVMLQRCAHNTGSDICRSCVRGCRLLCSLDTAL
jgi:hypothetical protein